MSPIAMVATVPAGASTFEYGMPFFTRAVFATSQDEVKAEVPTGLDWNEHSAGSAVTTTGEVAMACSSAGLALWVMALKIGKQVRHASSSPAMITGMRPILSERMPNTTKNGVPISSAAAIIRFAA